MFDREEKSPRSIEAAHSKPLMTTKLGRFIDRLSYFDLALALAFYISLSATFFYYSPFGGGFSTPPDMEDVSFFDALYYSVVTFSSLGYGDYSPVGVNRVLAGVSVFVGLAFFAVAIGKMSSERTQATLTLLHSSDVQRRLDDFRLKFIEVGQGAKGNLDRVHSAGPRDIEQVIEDALRIHASFRSFIIFNINQSNAITHGNDAAVASVMRELVTFLLVIKEVHVFANQSKNTWLSKKTYFLYLQVCKTIDQISRHKEFNVSSLSYSSLASRALLRKLLSVLNTMVIKVERNAYTMLKCVRQEGKVRQFTTSCKKIRKALQIESRVPKSWDGSIREAKKSLREIEAWRDQNILAEAYDKAREFMADKPRSTWKNKDYKALAEELGITNAKASKYISELISQGHYDAR
jgi:hypothetical protein